VGTLAIAYVLIIADIGKEDYVLKELKKVPRVMEAYSVYGVYDIVAKVETSDIRELKVVMTEIRRLKYVRSTTAMIVAAS